MGDVTDLLARWRQGNSEALAELMPLVYGELRDLAARYMERERSSHTLQPTALVHEAYMRLAQVRDAGFNNRVHFYGAAARAMRRILVEHARQRGAAKRGSNPAVVPLDEAAHVGIDLRLDLPAMDEALERLAAQAPRQAQVVELRYFGGMSVDDVAEFLGLGPATVKRDWAFARAWLHRALSRS